MKTTVDLQRKIDLLRDGITDLQEQVSSQSREPGEYQREELLIALEELHVAQEEMQSQNEQLMAAREALDLERQRYRNLFQSAPYGCAVTDATGLIYEVNRALEALLSFSSQFMVGRSLTEFVPEADQRVFKTQLHKLQRHEPLRDYQIHLQPRMGPAIPVSVNVAAIHDAQGRLHGLQWTFADASEQQTAEKMRLQRIMLQGQLEREKVQLALRYEQQTGQLKRELMTLVAHELRTPLATVLTSSQLLEHYFDRLSVEKRKHYFTNIATQIKHLALMLDDVGMSLSGEERALNDPSPRVEAARFCRHLVYEMQQGSGAEHVLVFSEEEIPEQATLDPYLLRHILRHLLMNAVRYSPEDTEISLTVGAEADALVLTVSDQGDSLLPVEEQWLFHSLGRSKRVGSGRGAGLGLKIARTCAELHGGTISVENNVGAGITFTVRLPLKKTIPPPPTLINKVINN